MTIYANVAATATRDTRREILRRESSGDATPSFALAAGEDAA